MNPQTSSSTIPKLESWLAGDPFIDRSIRIAEERPTVAGSSISQFLDKEQKETLHIHPTGYENSREEWFRLSPLDQTVSKHYSTYALIFELAAHWNKKTVFEAFKRSLELTLSQCRHVVGTIERNKHGDFSIVKKPDSTIKLVVQHLDSPGSDYPSYSNLERAKFTCENLGDPALLTIEGMTMACEHSLDSSPVITGFQLNFIPGGLIFTVHKHHFALDIAGTASLVHQIAGNCSSILKGTPTPLWDEALMDRSRFIGSDVAEKDQVASPPVPERHPDWLPCFWLLFHLPQSKSAELKQLATPNDGSWISTHDALVAFLWRVVSRNRALIYKPDLSSIALFGEPINMRSRLTPKLSERYQGNCLSAGVSITQENPLTLADIISAVPLPRIAAFIRKITTSVSQETLENSLTAVAPIRDKSTLYSRLDSLPPMSLAITDWRGAKLCDADFGFGKPTAFRQIADTVVNNLIILYPARRVKDEPDEGLEVVIPFEKHAVDMLIRDADMKKFFEFRGVEACAP